MSRRPGEEADEAMARWVQEQVNSAGQRVDEAAAQMRQRLEEKAETMVQAQNKALALLKSLLTDAERIELEQHSRITVTAQSGEVYRLAMGRSGNILRIKHNGPVEKLCVHPIMDVPYADVLIAQKLLLENDEKEFRRLANITPI